MQPCNHVIIIMEGNMAVIREPKTFYFYFDWAKNVDENIKHDNELSNEQWIIEHEQWIFWE